MAAMERLLPLEHDSLLCKLLSSSIVYDVVPLLLGYSRVRVLEQAHLEFDSQDSGDGFVDDADVDCVVAYEGRDRPEVERATDHSGYMLWLWRWCHTHGADIPKCEHIRTRLEP